MLVQLGGIGFLHYNCSIEEQTAMLRSVKQHQPGWLVEPVVLSESADLATYLDCTVRCLASM